MSSIDTGMRSVSLKLAADAPLSVCATSDTDAEAVDIPTHCALRCDLLCDLREQEFCSTLDLSVPLSMDEMKAWLECALKSQGRDVVDDRTQDIGADENKLLKALKVRVEIFQAFD